MGLAIDSIKDTFSFLKKYPKSFLFAALMYVPLLLGIVIILFGFWVVGITNIILLIPPVALGLSIIIISYLILEGGLPLLVAQAIKRKKIEIKKAIKESFGRIGDLFITSLIIGLVLLSVYLPLVGVTWFLLSLWFQKVALWLAGVVMVVTFGIYIILAIYIGTRLALIFPILMIERKGAIDSLKDSWKITKGKVLSLIGASILLALIVTLPLTLLGFSIRFFAPPFESIWEVIKGIVTATFSGILFTVYYYNLKEQERL